MHGAGSRLRVNESWTRFGVCEVKRLAWLTTTCLALALPAAAHADDGYVVANVNLRAGPDVDYPPLLVLPAGARVSIVGCVDGWSWCDVIAGPERGWVAGTFLEQGHDGRRMIVTDYGANIGIPIVAFTLGAYWDDHYRHRSWYRERDRWSHRHHDYRSPPRPHGYIDVGHAHDRGDRHDSRRGHDDRHDDDRGRGRGRGHDSDRDRDRGKDKRRGRDNH